MTVLGSSGATSWQSWLRNRFWLLLPLLLLNAALTPLLPAGYQPEGFSRDIPAGLSAAENGLRLLVSAAPLLMPLPGRTLRPVLGLYGAGVLLYAAAWWAVIAAPDSLWSTSLIGFTAPAWTSVIWLAGLGLGSTLRGMPRYRPWMYLSAAVLFTVLHTVHAALVWDRIQG